MKDLTGYSFGKVGNGDAVGGGPEKLDKELSYMSDS